MRATTFMVGFSAPPLHVTEVVGGHTSPPSSLLNGKAALLAHPPKNGTERGLGSERAMGDATALLHQRPPDYEGETSSANTLDPTQFTL